MKVIDFRLRPPYKSYLNSFLYDSKTLNGKRFRRGLPAADPAIENKSMDLFYEELDKASIAYGICPIRTTNHGLNEDGYSLEKEYGDRLLAAPMVDILGGQAAIDDIDKYVVNGQFKAITMETLNTETGYCFRPDDERVFDVYEKCEKDGVPVIFLSGGGMGLDLEYVEPMAWLHVARAFPKLKMILAHGNWPFAAEICGIAVGCPNMYLEPDTFMMSFSPAANEYITAANYLLQDKMLFGSAYPSLPLDWAVNDVKARLREEVWEKFFYENGAQLLELDNYHAVEKEAKTY